jgi:hypothetical protein
LEEREREGNRERERERERRVISLINVCLCKKCKLGCEANFEKTLF